MPARPGCRPGRDPNGPAFGRPRLGYGPGGWPRDPAFWPAQAGSTAGRAGTRAAGQCHDRRGDHARPTASAHGTGAVEHARERGEAAFHVEYRREAGGGATDLVVAGGCPGDELRRRQ